MAITGGRKRKSGKKKDSKRIKSLGRTLIINNPIKRKPGVNNRQTADKSGRIEKIRKPGKRKTVKEQRMLRVKPITEKYVTSTFGKGLSKKLFRRLVDIQENRRLSELERATESKKAIQKAIKFRNARFLKEIRNAMLKAIELEEKARNRYSKARATPYSAPNLF